MRQKFITFIRILGMLCGLELMCESFYKYITNQPVTRDVYISATIGWFCTVLCEIAFWATDIKKIREKQDNESNSK